jgi:hypothetical protein
MPSLKFQGGYAEAAYLFTGETRTYNPASASYSPLAPANPFSFLIDRRRLGRMGNRRQVQHGRS